jgi:hypothetical protein
MSAGVNAVAPVIANEQLPAMFRSADKGSLDGQWWYLLLIRADLVVLLLGALASSFSVVDTDARRVAAIVGAVLLIGSALLTWIIRYQKNERTWYAGRAVAESVKSMAWRYMTKAEPYDMADLGQADAAFVADLAAILHERESLGASFGASSGTAPEITAEMRQFRALDTPERANAYIEQRIQDQRGWYSRSAERNQRRRGQWFCGVIAIQVLAGVVAICIAAYPTAFNIAPVLATAASACLAWMQVKQHQELAQSYNVASHDLGLVEAKATTVRTDVDLSHFVGDAENAISREHTLWIARRDTR